MCKSKGPDSPIDKEKKNHVLVTRSLLKNLLRLRELLFRIDLLNFFNVVRFDSMKAEFEFHVWVESHLQSTKKRSLTQLLIFRCFPLNYFHLFISRSGLSHTQWRGGLAIYRLIYPLNL